MRDAAVKENDIDRILAWAGQSAGMAERTLRGMSCDAYGNTP